MIWDLIALAAVIALARAIGLLLGTAEVRVRRRQSPLAGDARGFTYAKWLFCGLTLAWCFIAWLIAESGHDTAALAAVLMCAPWFAATAYFARLERRARDDETIGET